MAITIFQCLVCEVGPPCTPIFRVTVRRGGAPAPNIATLEAEAHAGNPGSDASLRNTWHENRDTGGMQHLVAGPIAHLLFAKVLPVAVSAG
jgi:hypothetical protein